MKKILFLCTGNYYRSRFSEEYFNHYADKYNLCWAADSKGIMREFEGNGNVGPIAKHTVLELEKHKIQPKGVNRFPEYVYEKDFSAFDRVIAVSEDEHTTMLQNLWPNSISNVEYFDVEDLHLEAHETALPKLKIRLDELIQSIKELNLLIKHT